MAAVSLINQVLKDLERRHALSTEAQALAPVVRPLPQDGGSRATLWIAAPLVVLLAGVVCWLLLRGPELGGTPQLPPPMVRPPAQAMPSVEASAPISLAPVAAAAPAPARPPAQQEPAKLVQATAAIPTPAADPRPSPARAPQPSALITKPARDGQAAGPLSAEETPDVEPAGDATSTTSAPAAAPIDVARATIDKQVRPLSAPERANAEFHRGMQRFHEGRGDEAEAAWHAALATDPTHEQARQALLGVLLDGGRRIEAEALLAEGIQANPTHIALALVLARLQLDRGAQREALTTLEASLPHAQWSPDYLATTAAVVARASRHSEAAALYKAALRLEPSNAVWQMGLGMSLRADGREAEARSAFQRARDLKTLGPELQVFVDRQLRELQ